MEPTALFADQLLVRAWAWFSGVRSGQDTAAVGRVGAAFRSMDVSFQCACHGGMWVAVALDSKLGPATRAHGSSCGVC